MGTKLDVKVSDVTFEVEYSMSGYMGDAELEEVLIFIGNQEVSNVLDEKTMRDIDEKIYDHFWKNAPEGPEPDDYSPDNMEGQ